mmetsp:Transcript_96031/g.275736  ORF Transcript_96031/g.275736 Transcript_96031/m.275736 type:complete len:323 (-) Transcript_96031:71-1039(-)
MGAANCSCSHGCGSAGAGGLPPAPSEYEPQRGAAEESADVDAEEFNREKARTLAAMAGSADGMGKMMNEAAQRLETVAENTDGKLERPSPHSHQATSRPMSPNSGQNPLRIPELAEKEVEEALNEQEREELRLQAEALDKVREACSSNPQNPAKIEAALAEARQANCDQAEVDKAQKHLERVRAIIALHHSASLGDEAGMQEAMAQAAELGGVPESEIAKAKELFKRVEAQQKQKAEEVARQAELAKKKHEEENKRLALQQKQAASSALRSAVAEKDVSGLREAIASAEQHSVPPEDVDQARKVLAELEKPKKKGLFGMGKK